MSSSKRFVPLEGSKHEAPVRSRAMGPADPNERIEVTLVVRPRASLRSLAPDAMSAIPPKERSYPSREQMAAQYSADPDDLNKIEEFAHEHDLDVVQISAPRRSVVLSGTVSNLSTAFGVDLQNYEHDSGVTFRGRTGDIQIPSEIADIVQGVFGLDTRPVAEPHFQRIDDPALAIVADRAVPNAFTPPQVAQLYNFPTGLDGKGQCIGIIELGGGSRAADLKTYFSGLGIKRPHVVSVSVDGGHNTPGGDADGEVMLDIEVAGAVAPGAKIAVYYAPNTTRGFLDAITTAVHDAHNKPSVISISWGAPEGQPNWTDQAMQVYNQAFQEAAALGVTICAASGDSGSTDGASDNRQHVDFPSASPYILACGGTKLQANGNTITSEVVWNEGPNSATGGGVSQSFGVQAWQQNANVPVSANPGGDHGRGVPDVAGDADPFSGYKVRVDGQDIVIGGTSAVAPLWAGLIALINQHLGTPVGYINPLIYGTTIAGTNAFRDITSGNNGAYHAANGWDPCTGLGSPNGTNLMNALSA